MALKQAMSPSLELKPSACLKCFCHTCIRRDVYGVLGSLAFSKLKESSKEKLSAWVHLQFQRQRMEGAVTSHWSVTHVSHTQQSPDWQVHCAILILPHQPPDMNLDFGSVTD